MPYEVNHAAALCVLTTLISENQETPTPILLKPPDVAGATVVAFS